MTLTCCFVNLKPGTTKTTSAIYTAAALHAAGRSVLLGDGDKGASTQSWADGAGGFPWTTVGLARHSIARETRGLLERMHPDALVLDLPQLEDHAAIARGGMAVTDIWIVPVAPAWVEIHRTVEIVAHMDEVDAVRERPAVRLALLTRTNRRRPTRTGPDAEAREVLADRGFEVFADQVPHHDTLFRQAGGTVPDAAGTAYETLAAHLIARGQPGSTALLRAV